MHKFVRSLITEWRRLGLPVADASVVIAVSGGADSMSLLAAIGDLVKRKKLKLTIVVAHFNHKLRGAESDADEKFVRDYSKERGFEFVAGKGRLPTKGNLEQVARDARYKFLAATARQKDARAVLTAHTQNDQAETFLLNLIRGSGRDGLTGMKVARPLDHTVQLIRPLLSWATRADAEAFCRDQRIEFRSDRMNDDERFTRVRIRKTILPMLATLNPNIIETLVRTARLLENDSKPELEIEAGVPLDLSLKELKTLSSPDLYARLRQWLRANRGNLRSVDLGHIEAVERLIHSTKSGKTVELPAGGRVIKHQGRLTFQKVKVEK